MEVKKGYEQTEVGVIPEDWEVNTIASTTPRNVRNGIVDGPFGSNLKTIHYRKSGIPIITSGYVTEGIFLATDYLYVDIEKFNKEKRSAVHAGDIVMAKIGARCGASAILPAWHETGILSGNALKITVDNSRHSTYYIWQVLWDLYSTGNIEQLKTVGAQPAISMPNLKKFKIPLPYLPEQTEIANTLSDADTLISSLEKLIAKKRHIKQGAMQLLLTGKERLPGFNGEWEVKKLEEITNCLDNLRIPLNETQRLEMKGDYPYCGANGVLDYVNDYVVDDEIILIAEDGGYFDEYTHRPIAYKMSGKCWVNNHAHILQAKENIDQDFVFYSLVHKNILRFLASGTRAKLNKSEMYKIEIAVPQTKDEQTAIAAILSDMDAEIAALEQRCNKTHALKQGMMQELLTGKKRLI